MRRLCRRVLSFANQHATPVPPEPIRKAMLQHATPVIPGKFRKKVHSNAPPVPPEPILRQSTCDACAAGTYSEANALISTLAYQLVE
jgi:hypothetical protein